MLLLSYFVCITVVFFVFVLFNQRTAYEMRISDWSSDVCSSDLAILDDDVIFRRPQPAGLRWIIQRLAHQQTMHLEDPVDTQGAVLQMPQGLHHRVGVEDHLLAAITRLAPRAEHFLRDLARGG